MQALRYHSFGSPGDLRLEEVSPPEPAAGEVLLGVRCSSVNPVDWKIAAGNFRFLVKHGLPRIMGSDFAGVVTSVGSGVDGVRPGDRVWGFVDPFACARGTFADFCAVPVKSVFPLPAEIDFRDAAALACVGATAVTLCDLAHVSSGSRVLVNGASGGVGHVAVQVAKARGARVTATASGPRREFVASLGADDFVDYGRTPVEAWPGGFDAVLDCVPSLPRRTHRALLNRGAHYATTLPDAGTFLLDPITNRVGPIRRHGVMLTPSAAAMEELLGYLRRGLLRCHIEAEYPLDRATEAIERSRSGRVQGKLVIRVA
jgi:NADPH:quinone reductase-like Zn-dependent oxidoreductase